MILKFRVEGQTLFPLPTNDIPREGSRDYLKVDFDFGCGTEAYTKTVYFTAEEEGEEAPFSTAVVYEGEPIQVDDYFAQKSFAISVGFVLGERSYTTNEVSVPLDPASDVWLNIPQKPDIPAYQQLVNLAENAATSADNAAKDAADAAASADSAAKDAADAADAANAALQAAKDSGYIDVTEDYRQDGQGDPLSYLFSLGVGSWFLDDEWIHYRVRSFKVDGTLWQVVENWSDDSFYNLTMYANGNIVYSVNTEHSQINVGGVTLPNLFFAAQAEAPSGFPDGSLWLDTDEPEPESGNAPNFVADPDTAQNGDYWLDPGEDYVLRSEMESYVDSAIQTALAAIPIAEEGLY